MKIYFPKMISLFFVGTLLLTACGGGSGDKEDDPQDTTKPTISVTVPQTDHSYALGGSFAYQGTFTDDIALKEVVFSLTKIDPPSALGFDDPAWSDQTQTITLSGTTASVNEAIFDAIPDDVNDGVYQLTIKCYDTSDNVAEKSVVVNFGRTDY
ncbi:DUF4625 domain-containing protein [Plebeiibacterium marinum]|uniref:DUF4625 domain-containing protein n=1 Tax=Plebeiibacterium marinum TaxID=2992111 RepID=A0AAE3MBR1_9BACT|nr:DUF4625 domain-containing protein [Plebeiobacterium marinum]MCW3804629.1 DUF4625 domain-containing protein [Plebeiobacterium marinum]